MHVVLLTLLTAIAFGDKLQNKNLRLKQTNSLLLKTLKELTAVAETEVGCPSGHFRDEYGNCVHTETQVGDPCEGLTGGAAVAGNSYWGPKFTRAGFTAAEAGGVCSAGGLWYYNSISTCVGAGGGSSACDSSKQVCAGGSTYGWGTQQVAAVKAAVTNSGVHANCPPPSDPCEGITDGTPVTGNSYWGPKFTGAGFTAAEAGGVCSASGLWYYNSLSTCVGAGGGSSACDSSKQVCAGGSTYGWGSQQAAAVKAAVTNSGVHANCPPPSAVGTYSWTRQSGQYCSSYGGSQSMADAKKACVNRIESGDKCLGIVSYSCNGGWRVCKGGRHKTGNSCAEWAFPGELGQHSAQKYACPSPSLDIASQNECEMAAGGIKVNWCGYKSGNWLALMPKCFNDGANCVYWNPTNNAGTKYYESSRICKTPTAETEVGCPSGHFRDEYGNCVHTETQVGCPSGHFRDEYGNCVHTETQVGDSDSDSDSDSDDNEAEEGAVGWTGVDRLTPLIKSKDYRSVGDGYCNDYHYLRIGAYPAHLTSGRLMDKNDRVRECMNRCLAESFSGGFYIRNRDTRCGCATGLCSKRSGTRGEYHGYTIVDKGSGWGR